MRLGIGFKFLSILTLALALTVAATTLNATRLFDRDQLNQIYLMSDLITSTKAREIESWIQSRIDAARSSKGEGFGFIKNAAQAQTDPLCKSTRKAWSFLPQKSPSGIYWIARHPSLCFSFKAEPLALLLADNEPYQLMILNEAGEIILHTDPERIAFKKRGEPSPFVQRMLASKIHRQFSEFESDNEKYLGAFSKLSIGGLSVLGQISKQTAFETSSIIAQRSLWIAVFLLSIAWIFAYLVVQGVLSPVRVLQVAAGAISRGQFDTRANVNSRDEMSDLANSFNTMSEEIGRKMNNLSQINKAAQQISGTLEARRLLQFSLLALKDLLKAPQYLGMYKGKAAGASLSETQGWPNLDSKRFFSALQQQGELTGPTVLPVGGKDILIAPIREGGHVAGFAAFGGRDSFGDEDIYMAGTVLSSVGTSFQNIRLLQETADKARMEKELETAKHVQNTMFPPAETILGNVEVQGFYEPAAECGGDWWGLIPLPGNKLILAIGDATGHGVPSALVTATAKATFSVLSGIARRASTALASPELAMRLLNKAVHDSTRGSILMTFFVAVIDTQTGEIHYTNASHDPVYLAAAGAEELQVLECSPGPRLGQSAEALFEVSKTQLQAGDTLIFYTDGIPEGINAEEKEYGDRKFQRSIKKNLGSSLADSRILMIEDFKSFIGDAPLKDDLTLVLCRFGKKG